MPADQAAGLRRRQTGAPRRVLHCVSDTPASALNLARALRQHGLHPLLIDSRDRTCGRAAAQTLFDWRQQIERDRLVLLPLTEATGWHAPGSRAGTPGLLHATRHFDVLVFDCTLDDVAHPSPELDERALLVVRPQTREAVYALLKTRARTGGLASFLTGDPATGLRVREACARFLGAHCASVLDFRPDEIDAIAALAVRMAGERAGRQPRDQTGAANPEA